MIDLLAERPILISIMLLAVSGAMFFGWLQTGKRQVIWAALLPIALVPAAHWLAASWETDREKIQTLLYELAEAVESNDVQRAVQVIEDAELKARASSELQRYRFDMAAINKIREIKLVEGSFPQEADVELSVKVDVSDRRGSFQNVRVLRLLVLRMQRRGDQWVIIDYRHFPITGQPDAASHFSNTTGR
jgi:hypothetical protein